MLRTSSLRPAPIVCATLACVLLGPSTPAADQPQWGERSTRNMVSTETGLPSTFDPETGENIKWSVPLGTQTHSTPVVASGRVLIGTNNDRPRDPRHQGDRGVLLCLDEADGHLLWQFIVPKISEDTFQDWPHVGIVSPPTVEGNRVYVPSNRGEIVCLDLEGLHNGNDGPFKDEGRHMTPYEKSPSESRTSMEPTELDADIIWTFNTVPELDVRLHDETHCSILVDGPFLYACTSNGVDGTHKYVVRPQAPSMVVLEKATGRVVALDDAGIGPNIVHCTWSSPSVGVVNGKRRVFFGGADAICYAFDALTEVPPAPEVRKLKPVWWYDCDPTGPRGDLRQYQDNRRIGPSTIIGMPVFADGRVYVTGGGDYWHGKLITWLNCIDATGEGDVSATALRWSSPLQKHSMSTPSITDELAFISDCGRQVTCVDLKTGEQHWTHLTGGDIWGSTLVADGKVYVGTRRAGFWIFAASKEKKLLARVRLDSPVSSTPTAANGTLFVASSERLYAVSSGAK